MWSHADPVTLFGAEFTARGWSAVRSAFEELAASFSRGRSVDYDVLAAGVSGDLAYLVAVERSVLDGIGGPPPRINLRVTLVFRREGGTWRQVHRHGDPFDSATRQVLPARAAAVGTADR
jgi:ketosteroid isomerase-like protein